MDRGKRISIIREKYHLFTFRDGICVYTEQAIRVGDTLIAKEGAFKVTEVVFRPDVKNFYELIVKQL